MLSGLSAIRYPRTPLTLRQRGFTLVEMIIVMLLIAVLLRTAVSSFSSITKNAQVRTAAEIIQNDLRRAQGEAILRNRQVTFVLSNQTPTPPSTSYAASASGINWYAQSVPLVAGESAVYIIGGTLSVNSIGLAIAGKQTTAGTASPAVCFNSFGRLTSNTSTSLPATCYAAGQTYAISSTGATRSLNVTVTVGGQIRICDPLLTAVSSGSPMGC